MSPNLSHTIERNIRSIRCTFKVEKFICRHLTIWPKLRTKFGVLLAIVCWKCWIIIIITPRNYGSVFKIIIVTMLIFKMNLWFNFHIFCVLAENWVRFVRSVIMMQYLNICRVQYLYVTHLSLSAFIFSCVLRSRCLVIVWGLHLGIRFFVRQIVSPLWHVGGFSESSLGICTKFCTNIFRKEYFRQDYTLKLLLTVLVFS